MILRISSAASTKISHAVYWGDCARVSVRMTFPSSSSMRPASILFCSITCSIQSLAVHCSLGTCSRCGCPNGGDENADVSCSPWVCGDSGGCVGPVGVVPPFGFTCPLILAFGVRRLCAVPVQVSPASCVYSARVPHKFPSIPSYQLFANILRVLFAGKSIHANVERRVEDQRRS